MATTQEQLRRVQYQQQVLAKRTEKGEAVTVHIQRLIALEKLLRDFAGRQAAIQQDGRLTPEGKAERHATIAQEFAVQLAWLWDLPNVLEQASQRLANLLNTKPKPSAGNDTVAAIREWELRDRYRGKKQSEIDTAYSQAVERGNEELVRALILAPGGSLVTPAIQEEVERLQAKATNPHAFAVLEELTGIRDLTKVLVEQLDTWLRGLGADPTNKAAVVSKPVAA